MSVLNYWSCCCVGGSLKPDCPFNLCEHASMLTSSVPESCHDFLRPTCTLHRAQKYEVRIRDLNWVSDHLPSVTYTREDFEVLGNSCLEFLRQCLMDTTFLFCVSSSGSSFGFSFLRNCLYSSRKNIAKRTTDLGVECVCFCRQRTFGGTKLWPNNSQKKKESPIQPHPRFC